MSWFIDRTGQKFGKLTIVKELGGKRVLARCDCGVIREYSKCNLVTGRTLHCGCYISKVGHRFGGLAITKELGRG